MKYISNKDVSYTTDSYRYYLVIWRRKRQPTPVFLPGESCGRRSLVGCCPWGCTESDTTEATLHARMHALEKEMATHSSVLAWRIPGTEQPGGLKPMGSQRVRHDWMTNTHTSYNKWMEYSDKNAESLCYTTETNMLIVNQIYFK